MQEILIIDEARVIPVEFFRLAKNRLEITSMEKFSIINLEPANEPWVFLLALTGSDDRLYDVAIQIFEVYPKVMSIAIVEREMLPGAMEHGIFNNFVLRPVNPGMLLKTIQNTVQLRLSTESTGYLKRNLEKFTGALGEMGKIEAQLDYYVGKFRMIGELMSCLLSTVPLGELIAKVESLLQQELQCSHLSLLLFSSVNNTLLPAYGQKPTDGELELARKALDAESHVQSGDMENPDKDQSGPGQPVVYIPVRTGGKKLGVLCARGTDSRPPFSESEINILRMISSQVTIALEDSNIYQKIKKATKLLKNKEKDMGSLYDIEKTLRENADNLTGLYSSIVGKTAEVLDTDLVTMLVPDEQEEYLINAATSGSAIGLVSSLPIEGTVPGSIWKKGEPMRSDRLNLDLTFPDGPGIAMPVKGKNLTYALLCACRNRGRPPIKEGEFQLVKAIAQKVSAHVAGVRMTQELLSQEAAKVRLQESFSQYVSPEVAKNVLDSTEDIGLEGTRRKVTVFMTGLHDFHKFYSSFEPEIVVTVLQDFFTMVTDIVFDHGGTVDKFISEVVMSIFGAPLSTADDSLQAVKTAVAILEGTRKLKENWVSWKPELSMLSCRIAVNTGEVIAGNIGSTRRLEYTVIGDTVNTCARFKSKAGPWEFLIGEETAREVKDSFSLRELTPVSLKGKANPVPVFTLDENTLQAEGS